MHHIYHNNNCNVWSHKKITKITDVYIIMLFTLYKGMMMNWFNQRHMAKAYEWESNLCFDRYFILPSSTTTVIVVRMQQGWTALKLWWWVVNFTHRSLYCQGRSPQYPLNRWLAGSQSQCRHFGDELNLFPFQGFRP